MNCTATRHGTPTAYCRHGCRCPSGREAWRIYNKRRREGRNPVYFQAAVGTARRLQALVAIGWTYRQIARETGLDLRSVERIIHASHTIITVPTAARVAAAYDRMSTIPGASRRALGVASRHGWVPPLAWDEGSIDDPNAQPTVDADTNLGDEYDPITVGLAVDGRLTHDQLTAHWPDLIEAVRRLATRMSDKQIADHLRWPGHIDRRGSDAVLKIRRRHRIPAFPQTGSPIPHRPKPRRTTQAA